MWSGENTSVNLWLGGGEVECITENSEQSHHCKLQRSGRLALMVVEPGKERQSHLRGKLME